MGRRGPRPYLTDVVMDEVEEADEAATEVVRRLRLVARDGVVTLAEARWSLEAAEQACREVRDVVGAAEDAAIVDRVIDNLKRGGLTPFVRRRAEARGLIVPDFRPTEPRDAA